MNSAVETRIPAAIGSTKNTKTKITSILTHFGWPARRVRSPPTSLNQSEGPVHGSLGERGPVLSEGAYGGAQQDMQHHIPVLWSQPQELNQSHCGQGWDRHRSRNDGDNLCQ